MSIDERYALAVAFATKALRLLDDIDQHSPARRAVAIARAWVAIDMARIAAGFESE